MPICQIISQEILGDLCQQADASSRLRSNLNLHPQLSDSIQRFCNALQPGTYVRPHRHFGASRWELFVILQGDVGILIFDDDGGLCERSIISAQGDNRIIEIPAQRWHCLYALSADSVVFEIKPGPYQESTDKDFAEWAPQEGGKSVAPFLHWYEHAQIGDPPPELI